MTLEIEYEGVVFKTENMLCGELRNDDSKKLMRLEVVVPEFSEDNRGKFIAGVLKLLDHQLGEKISLLDLEALTVRGMPTCPEDYDEDQYSEYIDESGYFPFESLESYMDWWEYRQTANS